MLQVIQGPEPAVRADCLRLYRRTERAVWLDLENQPRRFWSSFRYLIPQLRRRFGDDRIEAALARHRVIAAFVLGHLRGELSDEQRSELDELGAEMTSHLTHNWFIDRPVLQGLAAVLGELSALEKYTIFIPNLCHVEPTTYALYLTVHRLSPDTAPDLVVGHVPGYANENIDQHGIRWGYGQEQIREILEVFETLPATVTRQADASAAGGDELPPPELDRWDDDLDGRAFELLERPPLDDDAIDTVIEAASRAFEVFGRETLLQLGLDLLESVPDLDLDRAILVHELIALTAHNRQFGSEAGDERFSDFLEYHFRRSLDHEKKPDLRLALMYRMAVTLGRRRKQGKPAFEFADRAVVESRQADLPRELRIYQEIWARNIRSYLYMRQGELQKAFEDSEAALALADELVASPNAGRDWRFTRTVLADNNEILNLRAGNEAGLAFRISDNFKRLQQDPESFGGRFSAPGWIDFYRKKLRIDLAIRAARFGLEDAGNDYIHFRWYFLVQLGDLEYRRGDCAAALKYFEEAESLRQRLVPIRQGASLALALAAMRTGDLDQAARSFQRALDHPDNDLPAAQAEILGWLARVAAGRGDADGAEKHMNRAIGLASEEGVRDTMLAVARTAGSVAEQLEQPEEAARAYCQGLEIAEVEGELPPPSGDVAGLLVGLAACGGGDPDLVERALELAPAALREDAEAWWDLPRLLPWVQALVSNHPTAATNGSQEFIGQVFTAASQRPDCAAAAQELAAVLPPQLQLETMTL